MSFFSKKKEIWVLAVRTKDGTPVAKAYSHPLDARDALEEFTTSLGAGEDGKFLDALGRTPEQCGRDSSFIGRDGSWGYVFDLNA